MWQLILKLRQLLPLLFLLLRIKVVRGKEGDENFHPLTRDFVQMLDDHNRYNRYATPTQYEGKATNVSMSMYIEGISSFSAQTMDYHLDMYFYQVRDFKNVVFVKIKKIWFENYLIFHFLCFYIKFLMWTR